MHSGKPYLQFDALPIDHQRLHGEIDANGGSLLFNVRAVFEALHDTEKFAWICFLILKNKPCFADAHVADQNDLNLLDI